MANKFKRDRPDGSLRSKATGPKGHYAQKEVLDDKYRPDGTIRSKRTGPKGHYTQKEIIDDKNRPEATGSKGQNVQNGPVQRAIIAANFFFGLVPFQDYFSRF